MTIDECITDCEQVMFGAQMMKQTEVYDYNRQLAEWLKELKAYREAYEEIKRLPIAWEFGEGVIRCLTIIEDCLEEVKTDADSN